MKLGMIGLGRMGGNMTERLRQHGHEVVSYARSGGGTADSLEDLVSQLERPRAVWMMIPAGAPTAETFQTLLGLCEAEDVIIDGGNSYFRDSQRRAAEAAERGLRFVDAGVSGGVWGLQVGYCMMVGGEEDAVAIVEPAFRALAPEDGYAHTGPSGAGHFVKMVHNGIEYGLMQAYAEGFDIMQGSEFDLDLGQISGIWRQGSVVRSWLLDLLHDALAQHGSDLGDIAAYVEDSGEGRWTVIEAIAESVPAPVITAALYARFASREDESFAAKINAALREQFGGHAIKTSD
jgi:6-phosphogluconate dehydrogenase